MRFLYVFLTMLEDIFIISGLSVIIGTTFVWLLCMGVCTWNHSYTDRGGDGEEIEKR